MRDRVRRAMSSALIALVSGALLFPAPAWASGRLLHLGSKGRAVKQLEVRVAAWSSRKGKRLLIDRHFGSRTDVAVRGFQRHYGLLVDGVVGPQTHRRLDRLGDSDGSTSNFDWSEFHQHRNPSCSRRANRFAGSFKGGRVPPRVVRRNVRRMMWRLEAIRAKGGNSPINIVSGFRSVAFNKCIGGARLSQHLYGTAADIKIIHRSPSVERRLARRSQIHGIICYSSLQHNHLDIRYENRALPRYQQWYWPSLDKRGRELASDGKPCWGEPSH